MIVPSLFQVAAHVEDFVPAAGLRKSATGLSQKPFAELMLHPEKLEAALKTAKRENDAFDAARTFGASPAKRATRSETPKNRDGGMEKNSSQPSVELKRTEFHLEAPFAGSVKLAADFTDWEKSPLDMIKAESGVWVTSVPLSPGHYSYRFIVDGQWCDDPRSAQRVPNPFGTANAVVNVT